jgi:branched-chain amino acid transport system ATP-binding protein
MSGASGSASVDLPAPAAPSAGKPLLDAAGITKTFGGLTAVSDFSVRMCPGEIVGLIGPNGAGKTTVFNLLTGVYTPDAGAITVCSQNTRGYSPDRVTACGIARTFQNIRLFREMTVLENVKVGFHIHNSSNMLASVLRGASFRREEARIEAEAHAMLKLLGLDRRAGDISRNLPYGEQRKLEIVRALATRPRVLLLDEPAAGMNESESAGLRDLLREIREKFDLTMLVIEHDMPFVMGLVQRILVLDHGETIAQGSPAEIRANPAVIEAYLGKSE